MEAKVREAQAALIQARAQAREIEAEALARRDDVVGEVLDGEEITPYRISKWTGLSHTAVANIQKRLAQRREPAARKDD